MQRPRVLVLGGYGFFGRRLVERLARQPGLDVILAGRSAAAGAALIAQLAPRAASTLSSTVLDATQPDLAQSLAALGATLVVHAAGPFQGQDHHVARACIAAGAHYVDLADGREFVTGISALDDEARAAGVAVLSGASSVPALSAAVADALCAGMYTVDHIDIGISPGNRTERGLSTVQGVLSYCGRPIPNTPSFGWSGNWTHTYPGAVGERLLSPCDVPDVALLPARHPGTPQVRFGAGLELRSLHRGMNLLAWLARRGWVKDWSRHAALLKRASEWFQGWGTDAGAMHVAARGRDERGTAALREWTLVATRGDGPYVPTLAAAALVARLARGETLVAGARPCVGLLTWQEILAQAEGLHIAAGETGKRNLFRDAMGPAYQRLAPALRAFHDLSGRAELQGEVETEAPATLAASFLALALGAPRTRARGKLRFELHCKGERQDWTRHFPHRTMRSRLHLQGAQLVEQLGPARLVFQVHEEGGGLVMVLRSMRFLGIPCPRWLLPRIVAREQGAGERLHFEIRASVPLFGQVTGYRGWLDVPRAGDVRA